MKVHKYNFYNTTMVDEKILNRKGARKVLEVPGEVLELLNTGKIETVNLTEWLAIDHIALINNTFPEVGISENTIKIIAEKIAGQKKPSAMNAIKLIGASLNEFYSGKGDYYTILESFSNHVSDSIRCYAPYLISLNENLNMDEKFNQSMLLVADKHFGVREVVWMALRPEIERNLNVAIAFLSYWAENEDENIRRFASESTRPRGVWCKHIEALKENPELALPVLEKLKSDPSKYVQDSVGNWLNDAGKTRPDFVIELCEKWQKESPTVETEKIVKKARRSIEKLV